MASIPQPSDAALLAARHSLWLPPKDIETYFEWLQSEIAGDESDAIEAILDGETLTAEES